MKLQSVAGRATDEKSPSLKTVNERYGLITSNYRAGFQQVDEEASCRFSEIPINPAA